MGAFMENEYCNFLKELLDKNYKYEDIPALLGFIEDFIDKIDDEDNEEYDEIINDLVILSNRIEDWRIEKVDDFDTQLNDYLSNQISYFE